ncbi:MAG: J domain-containing protein [Clostridiales bacterium]|nr:J domain-containing protein [Clostridiales bacterium]
MEELFDSEAFKLRYDEQTNSCVLTHKTYGDRDNFRTPLMHAVEIIKKHDCGNLIIEDACEERMELSEDDLKWIKKIIIPKLKESSCAHIFFVVGEEEAGTACDDMPYSLFADKFKTDKVVSEQFALMMIQNNCEVSAASEVSSMSREHALIYMGLPMDANDFMIDEKFWKLSKQYRGDNSPEGKQKIADLSAAYDIATGRRDERVQKAQQREMERKYFGKTGDEWRTYFSYTWYKYLIGVILLFLLGNIIYTMITKPGYDSGILSIGHFSNESEYIEDFMTTRLGFTNPLVGFVDIVVPNDQGQSQQAYADQSASTLMLSCPNVLVFDEATMPYYYSNLDDVSSLYNFLRENLSEEQFAKLRPIYMSERDAQQLLYEYEVSYGAEGNILDYDLSVYDETSVMVGIEVLDQDAISVLGYENLWPDYEPSLVFCVYVQTMDYSDSELIVYRLLDAVL